MFDPEERITLPTTESFLFCSFNNIIQPSVDTWCSKPLTERLQHIRIKRVIYQGDSLTPYLINNNLILHCNCPSQCSSIWTKCQKRRPHQPSCIHGRPKSNRNVPNATEGPNRYSGMELKQRDFNRKNSRESCQDIIH